MNQKATFTTLIVSLFSLVIVSCSKVNSVNTTEKDIEENSYIQSTVFINSNRKLLQNTEALSNISNSEGLAKVTSSDWGVFNDWSGQIEVRIWESSGNAQHPEVHCSVDPEYVLIGGGAWADNQNLKEAALLTGSYPENQTLSTWVAKSKDHMYTQYHTLHAYAIGIRLMGVDRSVLINNMRFVSSQTGTQAHPFGSATLPSGYQLIGGGADIYYTGQGNMLVSSYPGNDKTWYAEGKDHIRSNPASITVYAIGIKSYIPGFGYIDVHRNSPSSNYVSSGTCNTSAQVQAGYALACLGGKGTYNGWGRMLFRMAPNPLNTTSILASTRDWIYADGGITYSYLVEIRKQL